MASVWLTLSWALVPCWTGLAADGDAVPVSFLSDLPEPVRAVIRGDVLPAVVVEEDPRSFEALLAADPLEAVFRAGRPYRFDRDRIVVTTDRRWFATTTAEDPEGTLLVLRRWPGDTVVAYFALPARGGLPAVLRDRASPSDAEVGDDARAFDVRVVVGAREHRGLWIERTVGDRHARLGALILPGDAGLGEGAASGTRKEALAVWRRTEVVLDRWDGDGTFASLDADLTDATPIPGKPGPADEGVDPWRAIRAADFSVGLPPGLHARRTDYGFPPPRIVEGGRLWIRGRFADRDGVQVVVGDGDRAGYAAARPAPEQGWSTSSVAPVGVPDATLVASSPFETAAERARVDAIGASRFREPGFAGEWLVFRIVHAEVGVEIALPVVEGRRSKALFWIPVTYRPAGRPPAPPPIDPAERFGIRFDRLMSRTARAERPWLEGTLEVPGLRIDLPRDWWPVATLRSVDGFPVTLLDKEGAVVGELRKLEPGAFPEPDPSCTRWCAIERTRRYRAVSAVSRADGAMAFASKWDTAFVIEPVADLEGARREAWDRLVDSVSLHKPR